MGKLNREFIQQCDRFLESMNMTEADFKELMKKTQQMMRKEAERERGRVIE
jgi:cell division septum initiation protein DivIVA